MSTIMRWPVSIDVPSLGLEQDDLITHHFLGPEVIYPGHVCVLTQDIPEIGGREGDLLVYREYRELNALTRSTLLSPEDLDRLEQARCSAFPGDVYTPIVGWEDDPHGVSAFLARRRRWKNLRRTIRAGLWLVRPVWPDPVSEPVEARSDEGAIFELLAQLGCRPGRPRTTGTGA